MVMASVPMDRRGAGRGGGDEHEGKAFAPPSRADHTRTPACRARTASRPVLCRAVEAVALAVRARGTSAPGARGCPPRVRRRGINGRPTGGITAAKPRRPIT